MFNWKLIINLIGILLRINGLMMLLALITSLLSRSGDHFPFIISSIICIALGYLCKFAARDHKDKKLGRKDGYLIVTLGWIALSLTGALPYIVEGHIPDLTNAFFESISGYTTTGASILNDIEALPEGILFWRSLTQWIGGMGIIVLTIAILPILKIGGMELFMAEAPGPTSSKMHPRITETAKRLWFIYLILTIALMVLLKVGGMSLFDAINHAMTTVAIGGFSTKQASIAFFDSPFIQYSMIFFMIIAGTNFTLIYFFFKGKFQKLLRNDEFKYYLITIGLGVIAISFLVGKAIQQFGEFEFREVLFNVVSIITTTGFATADYTAWTPFVTFLFLCMMFSGGSAGSTSGGIKTIRHLVLFRNSLQEFKRILHPKAVLPVHIDHRSVSPKVVTNVQAFFLTYFFIFLIGVMIMMFLELDFETALGAVAASIGNVGPGIGDVGPSSNYYDLPNVGKWVLGLLMLVGRLELFTVLIILTPYFWRKN